MLENTLEQFKTDLSPYIDFELIDCLNENCSEYKEYHIYLADIKKEYLNLVPDHSSIILKELPKEYLSLYNIISNNWSPYLETVYGTFSSEKCHNYFIAINEFIPRPSSLNYHPPSPGLTVNTRSLSLEQYIRSFGCLSEKEALVFFYQLCDAVSVLHQNGFQHGDISPQNILMTDRFEWDNFFDHIPGIHHKISVKLIDFDIANKIKMENHTVTHAFGTLPYTAPEIIDFTYPTDRTDIYSLGCIFYFMLSGNSPKDKNKKELPDTCTKAAKNIFKNCTANYELRYKNLTQLKKDIEIELRYPDSFFYNIIKHTPGFRSNNRLKIFCSYIISTFYILCMAMGAPAEKEPVKTFITCVLLYLVTIIAIFDTFHIGRLSPKYQKAYNIFPIIRFFARFIALIIGYLLVCIIYVLL